MKKQKRKLTDFELAVFEETKKIPKGEVSTYAEIAKRIRKPGAARAVGNALNKNPWAPVVPCHRVIKSDGTVGGFASGTKKKIALLKKEGVRIEKGAVAGFEK